MRDFTSFSNGAVKLWSAYESTPDNEGIVLLCISGVWYPLYQTSDCNVAKVVCNQLGFHSVKCKLDRCLYCMKVTVVYQQILETMPVNTMDITIILIIKLHA